MKTAVAGSVVLAALVLAGCGNQGGTSARHGMSGGTRTPGASAPAMTLTVADAGKTVRITVGRTLAVKLDLAGGMSWHPPTADGAGLRLATASGGYPHRAPARATFTAVAPGRVLLHSITDARCLHARPSCGLPQRSWQVTVVVTSS